MFRKSTLVLISFLLPTLLGCSKTSETATSSNKQAAPVIPKTQTSPISQIVEPKENIVTIEFDYKGTKLNQTITEVKKEFNGMGYTSGKPFDSLSCSNNSDGYQCTRVKNFTIANQHPEVGGFNFLHKKLARILFKFDQSYFETVRDSLKQKYGEPTTYEETALSNKLTGVDSKYEELNWLNINGDVLTICSHIKDGSSYSPYAAFEIHSKAFSEAESQARVLSGKKSDAEDI